MGKAKRGARKGRLYVLESERTEIKTLLKELQQGVEDIRLHMARQ